MEGFIPFLKKLFEDRKRKNGRYSMRSYAAHCGISVGQLNDYFSGRRNVSTKTALKIIEHLNLPEVDRLAISERLKTEKQKKVHKLSHEEFAIISDPAHFAFLALTSAHDFTYDPRWITQKLNITAHQLSQIVANLLKVGLISIEKDQVKLTHKDVITQVDIPSEALRASHTSSMQRVIAHLEQVPVEKREVCSVSVCINPKNLPEAKKRALRFLEKTAKFLETGKKEDVYEISLQIFPWEI